MISDEGNIFSLDEYRQERESLEEHKDMTKWRPPLDESIHLALDIVAYIINETDSDWEIYDKAHKIIMDQRGVATKED